MDPKRYPKWIRKGTENGSQNGSEKVPKMDPKMDLDLIIYHVLASSLQVLFYRFTSRHITSHLIFSHLISSLLSLSLLICRDCLCTLHHITLHPIIAHHIPSHITSHLGCRRAAVTLTGAFVACSFGGWTWTPKGRIMIFTEARTGRLRRELELSRKPSEGCIVGALGPDAPLVPEVSVGPRAHPIKIDVW